MTDRPIIFAAPMVRALLRGGKTQTRRLATSPLRRCRPGDRLYVREHWRTLHKWDGSAPRHLIDDRGNVTYEADPENRNPLWAFGKHRQGMHMPRWASRMTLIITDVRQQPLQDITEQDCIAEGPVVKGYADFGVGWGVLNGVMVETDAPHVYATPRSWYRQLWTSLHDKDGQRWEDNPDVIALTFTVTHDNIDRIAE